MRWLRRGGIAVILVATMHPLAPSAAGLADGPGCLGVTAEQCVRWLRTTMVVDDRLLAAAMARRHQTDVNGRPLGGALVTVNARLPGRPEQFVILLHLRPDDTVARVESNLLYSLNRANTEPLYDQSGLYDIVSRLLGRRCPGLGKLDLYRFFENEVKPRLTQERKDFSGGMYGLHRIVSHAAGVPYCGTTFGYTDLVEWRGAADPAAAARVKRFSAIELQ